MSDERAPGMTDENTPVGDDRAARFEEEVRPAELDPIREGWRLQPEGLDLFEHIVHAGPVVADPHQIGRQHHLMVQFADRDHALWCLVEADSAKPCAQCLGADLAGLFQGHGGHVGGIVHGDADGIHQGVLAVLGPELLEEGGIVVPFDRHEVIEADVVTARHFRPRPEVTTSSSSTVQRVKSSFIPAAASCLRKLTVSLPVRVWKMISAPELRISRRTDSYCGVLNGM